MSGAMEGREHDFAMFIYPPVFTVSLIEGGRASEGNRRPKGSPVTKAVFWQSESFV